MHDKFRKFINEKMAVEDMPNEDFRLIASELGVDFAVQLLELMAGMWLTVPKCWNQKVAARYVKENFNGENVRNLVIETGLSQSKIYRILNEKYNAENQMTLEDLTGKSGESGD